MSEKLTGKVILVTGAAKRMGRAISLALAAEGARVAIHYGESKADAEATAAECNDAPIFQANLESVPDIRRLFDEVAGHFGRLDGLVNNAARFTKINPLEVEEADWDFIHNVNLKATFFACQSAAKIMLAGEGGRIVNISSVNGEKGQFGQTNYSAAKAGMHGFTMALAQEVANKGVTVNTVSPGYIATDMVKAIRQDVLDKIIAGIPVKRLGTPADIASMVSWVASDESGFATGADFSVNGGLHMG